MRLGISNIAWDPSEDPRVASLLAERGIDAIDVAPGKYFPAPTRATAAGIDAVRAWWSERGVAIIGMQALLFGTTGLNLFGEPSVQEAMLAHLDAVFRIGAGLGATRLVFGSPRNRDRSGIDDATTLRLAVDFFRRLGDGAARHGVVVCLEPNPQRYGCNFATRTAEAAEVVDRVGHPAIRMTLDVGALTINGEDPEVAIAGNAHRIGHIHASEPDLVVLGDGGADHARTAAVLRRVLPHAPVTIEMVAPTAEDHLVAIGRALDVALRHYGGSA